MSVSRNAIPILFLGLVGRKSFLAVFGSSTLASRSCWLPFRMSTTSTSYAPGESSICYVTTPNEESAKKIARGLVTLKLAACVNIIPTVQSIYEWEGSINEDLECMLMIKTTTENVQQLTTYVRENHPYSVAEVISVKIESGNPPYLDWISKTVKKTVLPSNAEK